MNEASRRAAMPKGTDSVLNRRNVYNANSNLLDIVKPGDTVLDVGCGSGTITAGIGELAGINGLVTGIDTSHNLIDLAKQNFGHLSNVNFEVADINTYQPQRRYDIVTSARVLQWVDNPAQIISRMVQLLNGNGHLTILDYNHEKVQWEPEVPQSMRLFYNAFLKWRADVGFDNKIADNLETLLEQHGFKSITVKDLSEKAVKDAPEFSEDLDIWAKVAETRGNQLVQDGYISEAQRLTAISDYRTWINTEARSMTLYLLAVTATL